MSEVRKGRFTFRFAAVCFGLSALLEVFSLQGDAPLFGQMVGGVGAVVYHAMYVALFAWLTFGLWTGHRTGYYVLVATSTVYTIDRLQFVFVGDGLATSATLIHEQLAVIETLLQQVGLSYRLQVLSVEFLVLAMTIEAIVIVTCWWGFVGYAYLRRDYFGIGRKADTS